MNTHIHIAGGIKVASVELERCVLQNVEGIAEVRVWAQTRLCAGVRVFSVMAPHNPGRHKQSGGQGSGSPSLLIILTRFGPPICKQPFIPLLSFLF